MPSRNQIGHCQPCKLSQSTVTTGQTVATLLQGHSPPAERPSEGISPPVPRRTSNPQWGQAPERVAESQPPSETDPPQHTDEQPPTGVDDEAASDWRESNSGVVHVQGHTADDVSMHQVPFFFLFFLEDPEATGVTISDSSMQRLVDGPHPRMYTSQYRKVLVYVMPGCPPFQR